MATFPLLYGGNGWLITAHMLTAGLPALLVYRHLKRKTLRPRPCAVSPRVQQKSRALDEFSFPSGHSLHAVCFCSVICGHLPASSWLLVPFTALVALSRPVLGLH
jgi:undecaprenyl-diphosphatase